MQGWQVFWLQTLDRLEAAQDPWKLRRYIVCEHFSYILLYILVMTMGSLGGVCVDYSFIQVCLTMQHFFCLLNFFCSSLCNWLPTLRCKDRILDDEKKISESWLSNWLIVNQLEMFVHQKSCPVSWKVFSHEWEYELKAWGTYSRWLLCAWCFLLLLNSANFTQNPFSC